MRPPTVDDFARALAELRDHAGAIGEIGEAAPVEAARRQIVEAIVRIEIAIQILGGVDAPVRAKASGGRHG